jgi:hypothetical protein
LRARKATTLLTGIVCFFFLTTSHHSLLHAAMARVLAGALALLSAVCARGAELPVTLPGAEEGKKAPIPEHFDAREEFYGCADNVLNQARARAAAARRHGRGVRRCGGAAARRRARRGGSVLGSGLNPGPVRARGAVFVNAQAQCGSCWAVSAAGTLADRYCVHAHKQFGYEGVAPLALSPQPLLSCASAAVGAPAPAAAYESEGCNGGYQAEAWRFLTETGTAYMSADQARLLTHTRAAR